MFSKQLLEEARNRAEYEKRCTAAGIRPTWGYLKAVDGSTYAGCICPGHVARLVNETGIISWESITREDWTAIVEPAGEA